MPGDLLERGHRRSESVAHAQREYNVELDPASYAAIFAVPCPVYWLPCFERLGPGGTFSPLAARHGTFYQFRMGEVFSRLTPPMQRFFLSMLDQEPATNWLRSLRAPVDAKDWRCGAAKGETCGVRRASCTAPD